MPYLWQFVDRISPAKRCEAAGYAAVIRLGVRHETAHVLYQAQVLPVPAATLPHAAELQQRQGCAELADAPVTDQGASAGEDYDCGGDCQIHRGKRHECNGRGDTIEREDGVESLPGISGLNRLLRR